MSEVRLYALFSRTVKVYVAGWLTCGPTGIIGTYLVSHNIFFKSFCRSQLLHKSVNLSFIITNIKNRLTDLWGS